MEYKTLCASWQSNYTMTILSITTPFSVMHIFRAGLSPQGSETVSWS